MRPIIEFCTNNLHHGTGALLQELESNPDYDVIEYGCLGNCGECYLFPFVFVNGETVAAPTAVELRERVLEKIKELEQWETLFGD